jgi:hypothetical protein
MTRLSCHHFRSNEALKNLAGALHTDGGGCTLSVGREVKMESLDKSRLREGTD